MSNRKLGAPVVIGHRISAHNLLQMITCAGYTQVNYFCEDIFKANLNKYDP